MQIKKKLICLLIILLFFGCNRRQEEYQETRTPVTFTINYAFGDYITGSVKAAIIQDFMHLNPHVTILENSVMNLQLLHALDEFPDLLEFRHSFDFVTAGLIGKLPPDIINLFDIDSDFEGRYFIAPISRGHVTGIIYNRKIFRELGISADQIKTFNDFLEVCQKIKNAGIAPIVFGGADIWHLGFWWGYFWQREVSINNPNWIAYRHEGRVRFTDPEVRAALTGLHELFCRGFIIEHWNTIAEVQCPGILVSGQAAMYYIGQFVFQQIADIDSDFEFGYFNLPDNYGRINIIARPSNTGWSVSAQAQKCPVKSEAIFDFIRYFFSDEVYANYLSRTNSLPTLKHKIDFPVSEQLRKVMDSVERAEHRQLNWNEAITGPNVLPPGFRNFSYRLVTEWLLNMHNIDYVLNAMDREWERITR